MNSPETKLTQTVKKGGCAAKVAASTLRQILRGVTFPPRIPEVLVDGSTFDDAAVVRLSEDLLLIQTLDFFTPIVDSPFLFGQIAAANAMSDVYAMGGTPKTCLAILAFPLATMEESVVREILQGAAERIGSAEASLVGGHSIDDETLKFGLSVTGVCSPQRLWTNEGAKPGDALILTKPLGTGTLCAALKQSKLSESDIADCLKSMATLNNVPTLLPQELAAAIHAATDITGFALTGHALHIAQNSKVSLEISFNDIPRFHQALSTLEQGLLTKAHRTNREYLGDFLQIANLSPVEELLLFDPQTSGGLLLAVEEKFVDQVIAAIKKDFPLARRIGRVLPQREKALYVDR